MRKRQDDSYFPRLRVPQSIGYMGLFYGSFGVMVKALAYMLRLGGEGLTRASEYAVLNANYLKKKLENTLDIPYADRLCAHEFVASAPQETRALDIAKALWTAASRRRPSTSRLCAWVHLGGAYE